MSNDTEDKKIVDQILDLPQTIDEAHKQNQQVVEYVERDLKEEDDYEYSREGLKIIINRGEGALEELYDLAIRSENIRAFEAIAPTMKSIIDAHKELSLIYEKRQAEHEKSGQSKMPTNGNTNVMMVTTEAISEALEKYKEVNDKKD